MKVTVTVAALAGSSKEMTFSHPGVCSHQVSFQGHRKCVSEVLQPHNRCLGNNVQLAVLGKQGRLGGNVVPPVVEDGEDCALFLQLNGFCIPGHTQPRLG